MTDLTARASASAAAQSFTIVAVINNVRRFAVLQALPPRIHTGVNLFTLFDSAFDDMFFSVVTFHVLPAVCFAIDYKCAAALLRKFYDVWRVHRDDFCFVYFVISD